MSGSVIVVDNGSDTIKAGFGGETQPKAVFPTIVGMPRFQGMGMASGENLIGDEANSKRGMLALKYPLVSRIVMNFEEMEEIWRYTFDKKLNVSPEEHPILLTQMSNGPEANREKMAQVMFETFKFPAVSITSQSYLSFYSTGLKTGLVLDSGHDLTKATPVVGGKPVPEATMTTLLGGKEIMNSLSHLLAQGSLLHIAEMEIVTTIKEKECAVALDFDGEMASNNCVTYELPDGNTITIGSERFKSPELLFQPNLIHKTAQSIHELAHQAIKMCDDGVQNELYSNIVLAGGTTLFPGFADRLKQEITALALPSTPVKVVAPENRRYSAWIGGSMLTSDPTFQERLVSKHEYAEFGPSIVHKKFA